MKQQYNELSQITYKLSTVSNTANKQTNHMLTILLTFVHTYQLTYYARIKLFDS